jgi:hypothetical protein
VSQPPNLEPPAAVRERGHYFVGVTATIESRLNDCDREQAAGRRQRVTVETYCDPDPGAREGLRRLDGTAGGEEDERQFFNTAGYPFKPLARTYHLPVNIL